MVMSLSVIISVWKRPVQLLLIFKELNIQAEKNNIPLEVIVADSYSGEDIDDVISESIPKFLYLNIIHKHTKNILASKRNLGAELATATHLIFLDDDCVPEENYILHALNDISKFDGNTILCGEVRFEPHKVVESNYYRYRDSRHPLFSYSGYSEMTAWNFVAMNCIIPKEILLTKKISYNDSFVGYGGEDHEFGWQIVKNNIKILSSSNRIIHHEYHGSIKLYVKKIQLASRDGAVILKKICPEIFKGHHKLMAIEWLFSKKNILGYLIKIAVFNSIFSNMILNYLEKTDKNKKLYFPKLYRYALISAYIQGMRERGTIKQSDLLNNWYTGTD